MKKLKIFTIILVVFLLGRVLTPVIFANTTSNYTNDYYRNQLSGTNLRLYDTILNDVRAGKSSTVFFGDYADSNLDTILTMIGLDNPEIINFKFSTESTSFGFVSVIYYEYDIVDHGETKEVIDSFVATTKNMNDIDKIAYVYNKLLSVNYVTDNHSNFTAHGALIENEASCEGFAKALSYFMNEVGIENHIVATTHNGVYHSYNAATIDGIEYRFDATFDATDGNNTIDYFMF
jgi:transglutaminase/protease-like cytokinesis protein 3